MKRRKGQGILEYVLILTAIIAALIIVATNVMPTAVENTFTEAGTTITNAGGKWADVTGQATGN